MICIGLERFFDLLIIPAPKRNSKVHCEIWTNPFLPGAVRRAVRSALRFTRLRRATRPFPVMGLYHDWKRGGTKRISLPAMIAVFEELNSLRFVTLTSPAFAPCHSGKRARNSSSWVSVIGIDSASRGARTVADQDRTILDAFGPDAVASPHQSRVERDHVEQGAEPQLLLDEPADRPALGPE